MKTILFFILFSINSLCFAETFQGIGPLQTFDQIQAKFPNAALTPVKAAWVTENDAFYSLSGPGFPGLLYIAFGDNRPYFAKVGREQEASGGDSESYKKLANEPSGTALTIAWMRWIPSAPIPVQRYFLKYGKQEKVKFSDADMQPYFSWPDKGIVVNVSNDEKMVTSVEFNFTQQENRLACNLKNEKKLCDMLYK
jgi:hypothetical protein